MPTLIGAGAVGLVLGARLARAGENPCFVTRRPEVAARIEREGVRVEDPATGETWTAPARAVAGIEQLAAPGTEPILVCVRSAHTEEVADALRQVASGATVVSVQNDVDNEAKLARRFARVLGVAFRQTCTRTADNAAVTTGQGRLVLGAHPDGAGPDVETLAASLRRAGYDVGVSQRILEDKWLKLCVNLTSPPNALVRAADHTSKAFVEIKVRLFEEARSVLSAAGIRARSCDGRDRSLDQEIEYHRGSLARGTSARTLPVYNQVWAALSGGGPLEADRYHRRILDLAEMHGVAVPVNRRVLECLERVAREGRGPGCLRAKELLG